MMKLMLILAGVAIQCKYSISNVFISNAAIFDPDAYWSKFETILIEHNSTLC